MESLYEELSPTGRQLGKYIQGLSSTFVCSDERDARGQVVPAFLVMTRLDLHNLINWENK